MSFWSGASSAEGGFSIVEKYSYTREAMSAYMRALGEAEPERQQQILQLQEMAEQQLAERLEPYRRRSGLAV